MKRLRGCLGILLIFGFGLAVGGLLGFGMGWIKFFHTVVKGGPVAVREIVYQRARDDLKLDYAQKEELRMILKETSTELDAVTAGTRPAVEGVLARGEERIRALLNPEQRRKFEAFINEGRRKWRWPTETPGAALEPAPKGESIAPGAPAGSPPPNAPEPPKLEQ